MKAFGIVMHDEKSLHMCKSDHKLQMRVDASKYKIVEFILPTSPYSNIAMGKYSKTEQPSRRYIIKTLDLNRSYGASRLAENCLAYSVVNIL
jgi:hypothetical protein